MAELWNDPVAQVVIWAAVFAIVVAVGVFILGKIRGEPAQHDQTASELLSKFRELHSQGGLSDAEFRTIKTNLAARVQEELKDNGETG